LAIQETPLVVPKCLRPVGISPCRFDIQTNAMLRNRGWADELYVSELLRGELDVRDPAIESNN